MGLASFHFVVKTTFVLACGYLVAKELTVWLAHGTDDGTKGRNVEHCSLLSLSVRKV
jgi:hypothetical protein